MSEDGSSESNDPVFGTPMALSPEPYHAELDPPRPEPDVGASPELAGPVTRSGKKRKNLAPVKSAGKNKNKIMTARSPRQAGRLSTSSSQAAPSPGSSSQPAPTQELDAGQPQDLAALLTNVQANIQASMGAMETRLAGKIDSLEDSVKKNKDSIVLLTDMVNKHMVDLARLEAEMRSKDASLDQKVADLFRSHTTSDATHHRALRPEPSGANRRLSDAQTQMYWQCRRSLRLWLITGDDLDHYLTWRPS